MADDNAPDSAPETAKTDGDPQAQAGQSQSQQPGMLPLSITAQYVKDLSFESPNAPAAIVNFTKSKPRIQLNVDVAATQTQDKNFEVTLSLNFEAKHGDVTDFIAELHYCGLCVTGELPDNLVQPALFVEVPRLLFPFARQIIINAVHDAGFPPLMINPIDFGVLYKNRIEQLAAQQGAAGPAGATGGATDGAGDGTGAKDGNGEAKDG
ncbi:MAG: protein-export chaperone SecB [Alphaproteobacteria bacterium]|nr:protein-export chaperone SecB [Alphaproteobacteria bacterium]